MYNINGWCSHFKTIHVMCFIGLIRAIFLRAFRVFFIEYASIFRSKVIATKVGAMAFKTPRSARGLSIFCRNSLPPSFIILLYRGHLIKSLYRRHLKVNVEEVETVTFYLQYDFFSHYFYQFGFYRG